MIRVAVISIGDELLKGSTANGNLVTLGRDLLELGIAPFECVTVPDDAESIVSHVKRLMPLADHLILTGGLGPTADDLTRESVAVALGVPLLRDPAMEAQLRERWVMRFKLKHFPLSNLKQAERITGAEFIDNPNGTAPGQVVTSDGCTIWLLPGPPSEMTPMLRERLIPRLANEARTDHFFARFPLCGVGESEVEERTVAVLAGLDVQKAYCASNSFVNIYLSATDADVLEYAINALRHEFGNAHVEEESLPEAILSLLRRKGATLSASESCTGGLLGSTLTAMAGSSDVFLGSAVTYANNAKVSLLGVAPALIEQHGAVSEACCKAMLDGTKRIFGSDAAIAITGIAGPGGGTPDKPVGTVFIGLDWRGTQCITAFHFFGDRIRIRQRAVATALDHLRNLILS